MRRTSDPLYFSKSWIIAGLIGAAFVALEFALRIEIEGVTHRRPPSWLDLALLLAGYLFVFCLKPIQATIHKKLCRRAVR